MTEQELIDSIEARRKAKNLTIDQLARLTAIQVSTLSEVLNRRRRPTTRIVLKLIEVLGGKLVAKWD